jgi:hypothetical protein|tara:strand:+ start:754 stop:933 length:180 start_codon:yes stop_codon:yes gene_type:complete
MNKEDKEDRYLELEKQAIDNFLEVQIELHGMTSIIADYLYDDEYEEYYQLEKELYNHDL